MYKLYTLIVRMVFLVEHKGYHTRLAPNSHLKLKKTQQNVKRIKKV